MQGIKHQQPVILAWVIGKIRNCNPVLMGKFYSRALAGLSEYSNFLVNFQDFETYFGFQIAVTLYVNRFWLKRGENDQIVPISSQIVPQFQFKTRCEARFFGFLGIHMSNVCFCRGL